MTLRTASVRKKREKKDGIRISIMRYHRHYYDYDMWVKSLAPSPELLSAYKQNQINWNQYEKRYRKEVLEKNQDAVKGLANMASDLEVTLLCWEETPEHCHRRLVAEECKKYYPNLSVVIK